MTRIILVTTLTILAVSSTGAAEENARKARLMQTHWQCSTWASMHGDSAAVKRPFIAGLDAGNIFKDAAVAGTIRGKRQTPAYRYCDPHHAGPLEGLRARPHFRGHQGDAFDRITTRGVDGLPLNPSDYIIDGGLIMLSRTQYSRANFGLL